jgi:hypothetical protein
MSDGLEIDSELLKTEQELLKSLWKHPIRRSTELIVPDITYDLNKGSLNNESWYFKVPYAFRDHLDIKYEQRIKDKMAHMVWTQGPILNFRLGDVFHSADGNYSLQVESASPMEWDSDLEEMIPGYVMFKKYTVEGSKHFLKETVNLNQMEFLDLLING